MSVAKRGISRKEAEKRVKAERKERLRRVPYLRVTVFIRDPFRSVSKFTQRAKRAKSWKEHDGSDFSATQG